MSNETVVVGGTAQEAWFHAVNEFARSTPWLHAPARLYAEYGVVVFGALLLISWLLARRSGNLSRVTAALCAPLGVLVALGINQFLVAGVAEERPYTVMPGALVLVSRSTDFSFPSDHAVMAGAASVGVLLAHRRLGLLTAGLAILMAVTRVYVGAHFPLDVAVGLIVGAVLGLVSYLVLRPFMNRVLLLLGRTPLRPLVSSQSGEWG